MTYIEEEFASVGLYVKYIQLKELINALHSLKDASLVLIDALERKG